MHKGKAAAVLLALVASFASAADETSWRARLSTVPIDPATAGSVTGIGEAHARFEDDRLVVSGTFSGLQGTATAAKLHSSGFTGVRGEAFADLMVSGGTEGAISGSVELTEAQLAALESGRIYIQLYSEAAPDGNLWGWLLR